MRRRPARTTFAVLMLAAAGGAVFAPAAGGVQAAGAMAVAPVSHPARLVAGGVAGLLDRTPAADPAGGDDPRRLAAVYAENDRLRQAVERLTVQLDGLKRLNRDRDKLGSSLRRFCEPAAVVGAVEGEGDLLQLAGVGSAVVGSRVLHTDGRSGGVLGTIEAVAPGGSARARLVSDSAHRPFACRFVRYDGGANAVRLLETRPFVVRGTGGNALAVERHQQADLEAAGVRPGDWAVLGDAEWPELLHGLRVGRVTAIEPLDDAPGQSRVRLEPPGDLATAGRRDDLPRAVAQRSADARCLTYRRIDQPSGCFS